MNDWDETEGREERERESERVKTVGKTEKKSWKR